MHCTRKQTSPPQILEANHKYTVPVKGPPQMRKNLKHCISERNPLQRNFRSHMAEAHARKNAAEILVSVGTVMNRLVALVSNTGTLSPSILQRKAQGAQQSSVRELSVGRLTCLVPRSHRNARACSFAARLARSNDLLQQGTRELCALARSADKRREVGKGLSLADTQTGR